ncbi:hypothetical protein GCM10022198_01900 [Klugiella xanthotipulae]|uniref:Pectate lyase-like protein n=1 Tax=Klugiella xanthotipulae TaxID=244735 RepID=A0A543I4Z5_9MICO|nr:glycosyl hydrolase family 28-related protein [Klugiella xanthotipulae]TQM65673.1 pectate lyase-like protein [Klugiella xanthotipulae]
MTTNLATNPRFVTLTLGGTVPVGVAADCQFSADNSQVLNAFQLSSTPLPDAGRALRIDVLVTQRVPAAGSTAPLDQGFIGLTTFTGVTGNTYTLSFWARGGPVIGEQTEFTIAPEINGNLPGTLYTLNNTWKKIILTYPAWQGPAELTTGFIVHSAKKGNWIEVKEVCLVAGTYTGDYLDGDLPTATWDGVPHASTSTSIRAAAPVRNVCDYGATGDNTSDDTAAIQAAFDDLTIGTTAQPATVYFPAGTYRITSQLVWDPYRVHLLGENATILCDLKIANRDSRDRADPDTYAVRVTSSAPFVRGNSPTSTRTATSSGIAFVTTDVASGVMKTCNGLYIEGYEGHDGWEGTGYYAETSDSSGKLISGGRRKNAHLTLSNMVFRGFGTAVLFGSFTDMLGFRDCVFSVNDTAAFMPANRWKTTDPDTAALATKRFDDRGERIYFDGCDFSASTSGDYTINLEANQTVRFFNCSFDWITQLLTVGEHGFVDFLGCHFETPADEFARSTSNNFTLTNSSATASHPYIKLAARTQVSISESYFLMNYSPTNPVSETKEYLAQGNAWAALSITDSYFWMPNVTAFTGGGVRVNITNPTFEILSDTVPMLGLDGKNNRLYEGVFTTDAWESSSGTIWKNGAKDANNHTAKDGIICAFDKDGNSTLSVTAPVTAPTAVTGLVVDLCWDDAARSGTDGSNSNITVKELRVEYLDRGGRVLGRFDNAFVAGLNEWQTFTPVTLKRRAWSQLKLVHYAASTAWNTSLPANWDTHLVEKVRFVITTTGGVTGDWVLLSNAYVNSYG